MALREICGPLWGLMTRRANASFKDVGVIFLKSNSHQLRRHFGSGIGYHREKQLLRYYQRLQCRIVQFQSGLRHQSTTAPTNSTGILGISDQVLKSNLAKDEGGSKKEKGQSQEDEEEKKQKENAARALKYSLYGLGSMILGTGVYVFVVWGTPLRDDEGREIRDEFSDQNVVSQYFNRSVSELSNYVTALKEPSREKLLPDPVKMPYYQPPYTLLLEITGVLVHPEWTYKTGWRFKKRPGVEYFLKQLHATQLFEIVIYTQESGFTGVPIVQALDTPSVVLYQLFRDSTKYVDGHHLKDLDRVNRDLSKVIMVDCNAEVVKNHRNNALVLPRWNGNDDDRTLFDLASLLQTITSINVGDVRDILDHYTHYADPIAEFREKRRLLMEQQEEQERSMKKTPGAGFSFMPSLFRKS